MRSGILAATASRKKSSEPGFSIGWIGKENNLVVVSEV